MISKFLLILGIQPQISDVFLTVGRNNFGNKISFIVQKNEKKNNGELQRIASEFRAEKDSHAATLSGSQSLTVELEA